LLPALASSSMYYAVIIHNVMLCYHNETLQV